MMREFRFGFGLDRFDPEIGRIGRKLIMFVKMLSFGMEKLLLLG